MALGLEGQVKQKPLKLLLIEIIDQRHHHMGGTDQCTGKSEEVAVSIAPRKPQLAAVQWKHGILHPSFSGFHHSWFQLPAVDYGQKSLNGKFQK